MISLFCSSLHLSPSRHRAKQAIEPSYLTVRSFYCHHADLLSFRALSSSSLTQSFLVISTLKDSIKWTTICHSCQQLSHIAHHIHILPITTSPVSDTPH